MKSFKALAAGLAGAAMALVLVWFSGGIVLSLSLNWLRAQGVDLEGGLLPLWTAWLVVPMPFVAVAVGFWAGFRFMLALIEDAQRQRNLPKTS